MDTYRIYRVGEKVIDRKKIISFIDKILELREQGYSQKEVAERLSIDRPFISRIENLGEIRKGSKIAVVAFPVKNKRELKEALIKEGVDFTFILTDKERWDFVSNKCGATLINELMKIISDLRTYDTVVLIGSNYRIKLSEALLDKKVIGVEIGKSPIEEDVVVDVQKIVDIVKSLNKR